MRKPAIAWGGLGLLALLWMVDFHLDVRAQDAQTWMDPYQYLGFAEGLASGEMDPRDLSLPSIFPFFLAPALAVADTIPSALWVNAVFMALLLLSVHLLCREVGIASPSFVPGLLVLASPLLIGLSRSLYVEFALAALGALACWAWLRLLDAPGWRRGIVFGAIFTAGFLTKMTFPLFVILPLAGAALGLGLAGRWSRALLLATSVAVPSGLVLGIQAIAFPATLPYYRTLGNTTMPIMYLIGPESRFSLDSLTYYPGQVAWSLLGLLTPFLIVPLAVVAKRWKNLSAPSLAGRTASLWMWFVGPLLLLTLQTVKEPRHVAPCVVPAVLLIVSSIERLTTKGLRAGWLAAAALAGLFQYGGVTWMGWETPYYLDRPLHMDRILQAMKEAGPPGGRGAALPAGVPGPLQELHWKYGRNVVLAGFEPNEALALTWSLFPGVTFDLDAVPSGAGAGSPEDFEDLFILAAFNTYNRRCGWTHYRPTIPEIEVVRNAEFILVMSDGEGVSAGRFPEHVSAATLDLEGRRLEIFRSRRGDWIPYRALYADRFLAEHPALGQAEREVVAREMLYLHVLRGERGEAEALFRSFPALRDGSGERRNIYWIGAYGPLHDLARALYRHARGG